MKSLFVAVVRVRHGDHVNKREFAVEAEDHKEAEAIALRVEANRAGDDVDDLTEGDGGYYSKFGDFHYSDIEVEMPHEHDAKIIRRYFTVWT